MKIYSYNVNGIRAAVNKGFVQWLQDSKADIVCIQETKAQPEQIPMLEFEAMGYHCQCFSAQKKGYSGVAILSKIKPQHIEIGMHIEKYDREGRVIRFDYQDFSVVSVYHPSGTSGEERQSFKMQWLEDFRHYAMELNKRIPNLLICGDYNICHTEIDIHDPKGNAKNSGFLPEERAWITSFLDSGFIDSFRYLNPEKRDAYSWWSYRANARAKNKGWRIDYCMASKQMQSRLISAGIEPSAMQSDHCPIYVEIQ